MTDDKKQKVNEKAKEVSEKSNSLFNKFLGLLRSIFNLILQFFRSFFSIIIELFKRLGIVGSLLIVLVFGLSLYLTFLFGYDQGEREAISNLTEEYETNEESLFELLEQANRFRRR